VIKMDEEIISRLEIIEESIKRLKTIAKKPLSEYLKDPYIQAAAERFLHKAIEATIDLANMLVARKCKKTPRGYVDVFNILEEEELLSHNLAEEGRGMAKFRILLVHGYIRVDPKLIYEILQKKLDVILNISKEIVRKLQDEYYQDS